MAVNLSVKNVPEDLAALLRRRAAANRRSLQRELLSILEAAVRSGATLAATSAGPLEGVRPLTIDELAALSLRLFPDGTESSVAYLRQLRASR